jgi:hypothetical protein
LLAIYSQNAILKIKLIKSSAFRDFQQPKLDKILRKIARLLYMGSSREAKIYRTMFFKTIHIWHCIWLNLPVDHHHFGYNPKTNRQIFIHGFK